MTTALTTTNDNKKIGHRVSKLTPELITKLTGYMARGNYFITACNASGISKKTAYEWINKGEEDIENGVESLKRDLVNALKRAEGIAEDELASMIRETALEKREWLPGMTFLERRHPERWGRKDRSTISIEETKTITITTVEVVKDYGQGRIEGKD